MIVAVVSAALMAAPGAVAAQTVPEGIHSEGRGPITLCGLVASNVTELRVKATQSSGFTATPIDSDRFELFSAENPLRQLVFTRNGEAAYPAATCRAIEEQDGSLHVVRSMRCEAGRAECDALFLEFQALDAQLSGPLKGEN
jgi:hypothetical protein